MPVISAFLPSGAEVTLSQAAAPSLALPDSPGAEDFSGMTVCSLHGSMHQMYYPLWTCSIFAFRTMPSLMLKQACG